MLPSHCSTKPRASSSCALPPREVQSLSVSADHSVPVPLTVLNRIFLWYSPGWPLQLWMCCLMCVSGLSLPDFVYPSKSLPIMVADLLVWDQGTTPGGEGATKLCFLSDLSPAASVWHRVFPPQLIKSLTRWCKASSVFLGFKNSYHVQVTCGKIS